MSDSRLFPVTTYINHRLFKKLEGAVEKIHDEGLRDQHWGWSSLIRELIDGELDGFVKKILKEKKNE